MGDKRQSIVDMVEAELLEEQQRANERPTKPPQEAFARVAIGDAAAIAPVKKERPRRIIEQVAVRHDPRRDETDPLSPREHDVLRLLALGHTNQEIAEKLSISVRTAETHRAHIMRKLELSIRAELVRYELAHGLLA